METSKTEYLGGYRTQATHLLSSQTIITDAPIDNNGKGEAFSPTDLVATALSSCMLTIMDMTASTHNFSLERAAVKTTKIMASNPRRIAEIIIDFDLKGSSYTNKQKAILENAAKHCPVAKSIHPDIKVVTYFHY
jgi:putative redox protein